MRHYDADQVIDASPNAVFAYVDDHEQFSSHMKKSSWMMGGGRMESHIDAGGGKTVGSHITMSGRVLGLHLALDEVVTVHDPPNHKAWQTVGEVRLFVIGPYCMDVAIEVADAGSRLRVGIDYELPARRPWLGRLFGGWYAKWCVRQMCDGVRRHFSSVPSHGKSDRGEGFS